MSLKKIGKEWDRVFYYLKDPRVPKTNNILENYNGVTLPHYFKHLFRTMKGFERRTKLRDIRWLIRVVIGDTNKHMLFGMINGLFDLNKKQYLKIEETEET